MRLIAVIVLVTLLAGCTTPQGAPTPASSNVASSPATPSLALPILDQNASVEAPVWRVGDAWRVESRDGDSTEDATLVVVAADGNAYTIATTNERTATFDAAFDVSYLGRIRASDLAGSQRETPVRFFDFPLSHGKTWTTTWDGTEKTITATFSPKVQTAAGMHPGFAIVAVEVDGSEYATYDYVPALGWWSRLDFAAGYGFTVKARVENWTGDYLSGSAKTLLTLATAAPVGSTPGGTFTVDAAQTSVFLTLRGGAAQAYARGLVLLDPAHQPYNPETIENYEMEAARSGMYKTAFLPPTPGQWTILAPTLHDPEGGFQLVIQQIVLETKTL